MKITGVKFNQVFLDSKVTTTELMQITGWTRQRISQLRTEETSHCNDVLGAAMAARMGVTTEELRGD